MATREELAVIKAARAGDSKAQLALGSRYLYGGAGLPRSNGTAFYWLKRAAQQGVDDACKLIGRDIPYEQIQDLSTPAELAGLYEKAFGAGVRKAGLSYARLVLDNTGSFDSGSQAKALRTLSYLASHDDHQAQWLLAQQMQRRHDDGLADGKDDRTGSALVEAHPEEARRLEEHLLTEAARAGIEQAQYALLDKAWTRSDYALFERGAEHLVRKLYDRNAVTVAQLEKELDVSGEVMVSAEEAVLLLRYAQWRLRGDHPDPVAVAHILELAALAGHVEARLELGLLLARLDRDGNRVFMAHGLANFKKAIHWLKLAGESGSALAWYSLARIHSRSIYSQRNLHVALQFLEQAAELGLADAQFELAQTSWRNRRDDQVNDVRALYWWQKAAGQGHQEARMAMEEFCAQPDDQHWAVRLLPLLSNTLRNASPFLSARVELAATFGLTKPEALLLDVRQADHGHCLVVDICDYYARSKRRLVCIDTERQRSVLHRIIRLFSDVDCSFDGLEGNYRQRQYRLKTSFPGMA